MGIMDAKIAEAPFDEQILKIRRPSGKQPDNTTCYSVESGETVASVAAKLDVTPSKLTRLNKLPVGISFLHPGQILYVPCNDAQSDMVEITGLSNKLQELTKSSSCGSSAATPASSVLSDESNHDLSDVPISMSTQTHPSQNSISESSIVSFPSKDEHSGHESKVKEYLGMRSKLITDFQGVINGSLLATPNVLRFDPHVSDPVVLEKGAESFCMEARMDKVVSLAIYSDFTARDNLERIRNGSLLEIPEVYHPCEVDGCRAGCSSSITEYRQIRFDVDIGVDLFEDLVDKDSGTSTPTKDFTDSIEIPKNPGCRLKRNVSSSASYYRVNISPSVEVFVNYKCGIFLAPSISSLVSGGKTPQGATNCCAENEVDGHVKLHSAVAVDEKPDLFRTVSEILPNKLAYDCHQFDEIDDPHYLQIILDTSKKTKKTSSRLEYTEYWITIPQNRVEDVFNFFTLYHPSLYGNADKDLPVKPTRFVALSQHDRNRSISQSPSVQCLLSSHRISKEWEIVSLDEIMRRKSLLDIEKYLPLPTLHGNSVILTKDIIENLTKSLPARSEGFPWTLAFGTEQHGFSLSTLYRSMRPVDSPVLLIVKDTNENVFGAYLSEPPIYRGNYFGTGECFLFSCTDGFKLYGWTAKNNFHICTMNSGLEIGAGSGKFGLWMDAGLYHGRTQKCETYNNEPLTCGSQDFIIANVEVWCFMEPDDCDFVTGTLDL